MPKTEPRFVPFGEAFNNFFKGYVVWKGRATRAEYWWIQLVNTIISIVPYVGIAWGLATLLPGISVTIRRLHDTSRSGFWYLGIFGGLIAGIILTAVGGAAKEAALIALGLIAILACGITSIVLMCLPSTPGKNKYGELRK